MAPQPEETGLKPTQKVQICHVKGSLSKTHICSVELTPHFDPLRCHDQYGAAKSVENHFLLTNFWHCSEITCCCSPFTKQASVVELHCYYGTMATLFIALFILQLVSPPSFSPSLLLLLLPCRDGPTSL